MRTVILLAFVALFVALFSVRGPRSLTKSALWSEGTRLRGANIWQKRIERKYDGDSFGNGELGPPYSLGDFQALAGLGANLVNVSHPGLFTERPPYRIDPAAVKNLESLLEVIRRADMFAVISLRTGPGRNEAVFDDREADRALQTLWREPPARYAWVRMWRETAARFRSSPVVVGYHLMVEPHGASSAQWNRLAGRIIREIREVDRETPILVSGLEWGRVSALEALSLPEDPGLIYVFHQYEPFAYVRPRSPLAVLEFGIRRREPGAATFLEKQVAAFEELGLNHAIWLWESSWPGIGYDEFNYRKSPDLLALLRRIWSRNVERPSRFHGLTSVD